MAGHSTDKWDSQLDKLGSDVTCMILAPRPSKEGLHRVLLGLRKSEDSRRVELAELAPELDAFADAYTDQSDSQELEGFQFSRSHSPSAGMDDGPRSGKGYGYALYSTLALTVAGDPKRSRAGVFSPEGGASESAEAMWTRLVDLGAAELSDGEEEEVEVDHCEGISDSDTRYDGRSATITDSEICGTVSASVGGESVRYLAAWHLLHSGWLLDWRGASAWYTRIGNKYPAASSRVARLRDWRANPEVLMRADPGPDATPAQIRFVADRILALSDRATWLRFLQREDIFTKLPVKMQDYYHPDQTGMRFLSGVGRSGAARLGTTGTQLRPQALPAPSAGYKALASRWSALDF